jgi:putative DNA primase/helicase
LAEAIIANSPRIVKSYNKLYIYNDFTYKILDVEEIEKIIMDFFVEFEITDRWKTNVITEINKAIRASNQIKEVEMNSHSNLLCLANKILDINTLKTFDHSDQYYFTTYVDVNYDETAKDTPNFIRFLQSVFTLDNGAPDEETVKTACYIGAYLLYPQNKIKKMFLFLGDGANGKSLLIDVYKLFFSKNNITALSLEALSDENNFGRECLVNSRINVATEAKGREIDSEELKKIISGEEINIARKFKQNIDIKLQTKIIIASNSLPYFADTSHGIDRRFYIVNFKNKFVDKSEEEQYSPADRVFLAKDYDDLMTKFRAEGSGILNLFIEFLKYLMTHNWVIPATTNSIESKAEYKENTDILGTWLLDNYEKSNDIEMKVEDIYADYKNYYENNVAKYGLKLSTTKLGKRINEIFRIKSNVNWDPMSRKMKRFYNLKVKTCQVNNPDSTIQVDENIQV